MNIYLVSQDDVCDYDTYDSFICYAESEEEARYMSPDNFYRWINGSWHFYYSDGRTREHGCRSDWSLPSEVEVKLIGATTENVEAGVILSSFNAG